MKKYIIIICSMYLVSCGDILDVPDVTGVNTDVWNNEVGASLYVNRLYEVSLPGVGFGVDSGFSDESYSSNNTIYGNLTADDVSLYSVNYYRRIRDTNIGLEGLAGSTLPDDAKGRLRGQMTFLRALDHWNLVLLYGGVPMVLEAQDPYGGEAINLPRNTARECIDILVADLDEAIAGLPASWPNNERGRITRGAAAAMKGRILLFWASPQFNPANDQSRWERAYQANLEAKELLLQDGYGLHPNFTEVFTVKGNREVVFARLFDFNSGKTHGWENSVRPRQIGNNGGTGSNPTWEMVKAFPMSDGVSIDNPDSGYDSIYYFKDRDPRFYATIAYNGVNYTATGFDPNRKQWSYYVGDNPVDNPGATTTGFYCRKATNPNIQQQFTGQADTDWPEIRFAEVLLNLAEAAAETDRSSAAYAELYAIRQRAGISAGDGNYGVQEALPKADLVDAIMHERQIELAYENKRYWDLRRRNLFEQQLNGTRRHGIITRLKAGINPVEFEVIRDQIDLENDYDQYFEMELWVKDQQFVINYPQPQYNFFGIPQNVRDRSPEVEQTILWENGTFDPLRD
ncbi:RagB/SusD family nutrient uptake outer membrane protein [Belliella sp. DSM 111904]|uniref:RagB/SusD family nutrient uptake outer membrane protein n=1 Tax=Belliella filtrata TaxID=2923435 RepID=A0ABS9UVV6_9BACT|nr:RagB/SusD family nutrient uptake outer membrane protein [Belliella filtrata]MCH7408090.1 RagB/SusD family nutrient uptake outer membrane protein [Belliella filtrata]